MKKALLEKLPLFLAILLYILIYFLRLQQVLPPSKFNSHDSKIDIFKSQRGYLDQRISQLLPSPQAQLLSGILLGQNKDLPSSFKLALRDTSTLHIVVASGQNLSIAAGFFLALAGLIRRRTAIILSMLVAIGYTLLTGLQVPILRAAIMFVLSSLAAFFGRAKEGWRVLILTAGLMLLINPYWVVDLSFQLSFLATFGVIVVAPILLRYLKSWFLIGPDLAVTLGAQLLVTPVIIQNFHQLSLVSVFANLLVGFSVPFIMIFGAIMLFVSLISTSLGWILSLMVSALLTYFIYIVSFFSSLPFAWEYVGEQGWFVWAGYYMVLGGMLLALSKIEK